MTTARPNSGNALLTLLFLAVAAGAFAWLLMSSEALPDGPLEVIWDKTPCAECSMHVGDPAFAAQMITDIGEELYFDDPGCWFLYEARAAPIIHAAWFRHMREDRWLPYTAVAFAAATDTPMGFDIGAVDPGEPESISLDAARRKVLER